MVVVVVEVVVVEVVVVVVEEEVVVVVVVAVAVAVAVVVVVLVVVVGGGGGGVPKKYISMSFSLIHLQTYPSLKQMHQFPVHPRAHAFVLRQLVARRVLTWTLITEWEEPDHLFTFVLEIVGWETRATYSVWSCEHNIGNIGKITWWASWWRHVSWTLGARKKTPWYWLLSACKYAGMWSVKKLLSSLVSLHYVSVNGTELP